MDIWQNYEEYITDAILLSMNASYNHLYNLLASHINIDLSNECIQIWYKIPGSAGQINIHNDMGLKVYILQKKEIQEMNYLPLYVSILEKDAVNIFASSLVCDV